MTERSPLAVTDHGTGPVLVFVHGFMNDATIWSGVVELLADQYRCVTIDLPGHGASAGNGAGTYGRDAVLDDVRVVLDSLGEDPVVMVGHSLGGYLSLALAIEDPARVRGLGLVGAGPGFRNPDSREKWNESVRKLATDNELADGMEAISMHVDAMVMDRLSEIQSPTAVIVGERDKRFMASADVFAKYLNVTHTAVVPDAGHMVHLKQPAGVAQALRQAFPV